MPSTRFSLDQASTMTDITGPAVDTAAFRAEDHRCGSRPDAEAIIQEFGTALFD